MMMLMKMIMVMMMATDDDDDDDEDDDDDDLRNDEEMRASVANGQCSAPLSSSWCQQQLSLFVFLYLGFCICVFVFVYLYLCILYPAESFLTLASLLCVEIEPVAREVCPLGELDQARGVRALCHLCPANKKRKGGAAGSAA